MTAPLDFYTVTDAMPAFAFGLASRIGYEAFGVLPAAPSSFAGPAESNSTYMYFLRFFALLC